MFYSLRRDHCVSDGPDAGDDAMEVENPKETSSPGPDAVNGEFNPRAIPEFWASGHYG